MSTPNPGAERYDTRHIPLVSTCDTTGNRATLTLSCWSSTSGSVLPQRPEVAHGDPVAVPKSWGRVLTCAHKGETMTTAAMATYAYQDGGLHELHELAW